MENPMNKWMIFLGKTHIFGSTSIAIRKLRAMEKPRQDVMSTHHTKVLKEPVRTLRQLNRLFEKFVHNEQWKKPNGWLGYIEDYMGIIS